MYYSKFYDERESCSGTISECWTQWPVDVALNVAVIQFPPAFHWQNRWFVKAIIFDSCSDTYKKFIQVCYYFFKTKIKNSILSV